jgi:hypothetical protein
MTTTNQNASQIQQMLRDLQSKVEGVQLKVDAIPILLASFDARVAKLEMRVDKIEENGRLGMQWANDEHQAIREAVHTAKNEIVRDVGLKIDGLQTKMEEGTQKTWEQRIGHIFATIGWIVAIALSVLGYSINFILSHPTPGK